MQVYPRWNAAPPSRADERARVEWEREEEAKRAAKLAMMDRLKEDREAQIDQIKTDRERVIETRKKVRILSECTWFG